VILGFFFILSRLLILPRSLCFFAGEVPSETMVEFQAPESRSYVRFGVSALLVMLAEETKSKEFKAWQTACSNSQ